MDVLSKYRISHTSLIKEATSGERNCQNSRRLDVHKVSDYPEVKVAVDKIYDRAFRDYRPEKIKKHIQTILLNLLVNHRLDPELCTAVPLSPNAYKAKSRYNKLHISKKNIDVVHRLNEVGLIGIKKGWKDETTKRSFVSRIWPSEEMLFLFEDSSLDLYHVGNHPDRETIILKNEDKDLTEYEDTLETMRMREHLRSYNDLLATTDINIAGLDKAYIELPNNGHRIYLTPDHFVRRIFNNDRWDHGGRFYGGFWQRIPSEWREQIFINGEPTIELDYSGLHIVLLYRLEGIDYWKEIDEDPYYLEGVTKGREFIKTLLLTAINAKDERDTFRAMRESHKKEHGYFPKTKDEEFRQVLRPLKRKHKAIEHKLCSGAGVELMNTDSKITESIINHFMNKGIPILSIHDSYIVNSQYKDELQEAMQNSIKENVGPTTIIIK